MKTTPVCSLAAAVVVVVADDEVFSHHVGGEDEDSLVFSTRPLRIIQQIWVVLAKIAEVITCKQHKKQVGPKVNICKTCFPIIFIDIE